MDQFRTHNDDIAKTKFKTESRDNILKKLALVSIPVQSVTQPFAIPQQNLPHQCGKDDHTQENQPYLKRLLQIDHWVSQVNQSR